MSKERPAIGANGLPLPILPPERDVPVGVLSKYRKLGPS